MKRLLAVIAFALSACPSTTPPPEQHYTVTDTNGTEVIDVTVRDDKHRDIASREDTTMHVLKGSRFTTGRWNFDDDSGANVLDTEAINNSELRVRGLGAKDSNGNSGPYVLSYVKIESARIRVANNSNYENAATILPDKVLDRDGKAVLGSVSGMDVKDASGKTLYHVTSGSPCACYGVLLLNDIPPMSRAAILQYLLNSPQ